MLCKVHPELLFTPHTHPGLTDQLPWLAKVELTHSMVPLYSDLNGKQDVGLTDQLPWLAKVELTHSMVPSYSDLNGKQYVGLTVALNIGNTVAETLETG